MRESEKENRKISKTDSWKNSNCHHPNPRSRNIELRELIKKYFQEALKSKKRIKKEIIDKMYRTLIKDMKVHEAWHTLFVNRFVWEIITTLTLWQNSPDVDFNIFLQTENRKKAWKIVFGDEGPARAIEIIKKDWVPFYPDPFEVIEKTSKK